MAKQVGHCLREAQFAALDEQRRGLPSGAVAAFYEMFAAQKGERFAMI
jgi:hypothetical protein